MEVGKKPKYRIGDKFEIPKERGCGHIGEIIRIIDEKTIVVKCYQSHSEDSFTKEPFKAYDVAGRRIKKKNIAYLIDPR